LSGGHRRWRRTGDLWERIDARERTENGAGRRNRVQALQDQRLLHLRAQLRLTGNPGEGPLRRPRRSPVRAPRLRRGRRASRACRKRRDDRERAAGERPDDRRDGPAAGERRRRRAERHRWRVGANRAVVQECGARRAPNTAPAASPASEIAVAKSPRLSRRARRAPRSPARSSRHGSPSQLSRVSGDPCRPLHCAP